MIINTSDEAHAKNHLISGYEQGVQPWPCFGHCEVFAVKWPVDILPAAAQVSDPAVAI